MPRKYIKKEGPGSRRVVFDFKHDVQNDISPFLNTFRSFLYETRANNNRHKVRDVDKENTIMREIMSMKMGVECAKSFDVFIVAEAIKELAGMDENREVVGPEMQMQNCCKFLSEKTGMRVFGIYFDENLSEPLHASSSNFGELNLVLLKLADGKFGICSWSRIRHKIKNFLNRK